MPRRRPYQQGGSAPLTGVDISGIATFTPDSIRDLALWIIPEQALLHTMTVGAYADTQPPLIRAALIKTFGAELQHPVITEIKSNTPRNPNSLIPLEIDSSISYFPERLDRPGQLPALTLIPTDSGMAAPKRVVLVTKTPLDLPQNATTFALGKGVRIDYNDIVDRLVLSADAAESALQELIIYARTLAQGEQETLEGYLAYRANTQYALAEGHPYLPDMRLDPSIRELTEPLRATDDTLRRTEEQLSAATEKAMAIAGGEPALQQEGIFRGRLADSREAIRVLLRLLSKGVLAARPAANGGLATVDQVFAAIQEHALGSASRESVQATVAAGQQAAAAANEYIRGLTSSAEGAAADTSGKLISQTLEVIRREAETEELLGTTEAQIKRREQLTALRTRDAGLIGLGKSLLRERAVKYFRELDLAAEAFTYQAKRREEAIAATEGTLRPLLAAFRSGEWLVRFPFLSTDQVDGAFKEPLLATLAEKHGSLASALDSGDIPAAKVRLDALAEEAASLHSAWSKMPIHSLFPNLYLRHLKVRFVEADRIHTALLRRLEELRADAEVLAKELEHLTTYQTVSPARLSPATAVPGERGPVYLALLSAADAQILRAAYVETDVSGAPLPQATPLGALDLVFGFQTGVGATVLPRLKDSVLAQISPDRFPPPLEVALNDQPIEVPRDADRLIRFRTPQTGLLPPVSLPKYAVPSGAAIVLQNLGPQPIWIRNPGMVDDALDLLGPGETAAYLYSSSAMESPGYAYGRCPWVEGMLPYDTLYGAPRSAICSYHDGLKKFIYMDPAFNSVPQPLRTADGNCIETLKSADGNVYDGDDFGLSNPYSVKTVPGTFTEAVTLHPIPESVSIQQDSTTGVAVFCQGDTPLAGEFGLLKICSSPLLWFNGTWKTKGANGDLRINAAGDTSLGRRGYVYPDGLVFDHLFRSRFFRKAAQEIFTTSQGTPLGSAAGTWIAIPNPIRAMDIVNYKDNGTTKQAFLVKDVDLGASAPIAIVSPTVINTLIVNQRVNARAALVLYRYTSAVAYAQTTITRLIENGKAIQVLGDSMTESIRNSIDATKTMIEERAKGLTELETTIQGIERAIATGSIPNDIQISLGTLDLSLRDKLTQITDLLDSIREPLQNYMLMVESSARLKGFVATLRQEATQTFSRGFDLLHALQAAEVARSGTVSSPQVEAVAVTLRTNQQSILSAQDALEAAAAKSYAFVSELREGLLELQHACGTQFMALAAAKDLLRITLPRLLAEEKKMAATRQAEQVKSQEGAVKELVRRLERYVALVAEPGPGNSVRDEPGEAGPFAHATMPSVERDIRPLVSQIGVSDELRVKWLAMADSFVALNQQALGTYRQVSATTIPEGVSTEIASQLASAAKDSVERLFTAFKAPMDTYTALAKEVFAASGPAITKRLGDAGATVEELADQRAALDTLSVGLYATLDDAERQRLTGIREALDRLALDSLQSQLTTAKETLAPFHAGSPNPFRLPEMLGIVRRLEESVREVRGTLEDQLSAFTGLRDEVIQRLRGLIGEANTVLRGEVETLRAKGVLTAEQDAAAQAIYQRQVSSLADAVSLLEDSTTLKESLIAMRSAT